MGTRDKTSISANYCDIPHVLRICSDISSNPYLNSLYLSDPKLDEVAVSALVESLRKHKSVTHLFLPGSLLTPMVGVLFAPVINFGMITSLTLSRTKLSGEVMEVISREMSMNKTIQIINLNDVGATPSDTRTLFDALWFNQTLKRLFFGFNDISGEGVQSIATFLLKNNCLELLAVQCAIVDNLSPVFESLVFNSGVSAVDFHGIKNVNLDPLVDSLASNFSLTDVTGTDNQQIKQICKKNERM